MQVFWKIRRPTQPVLSHRANLMCQATRKQCAVFVLLCELVALLKITVATCPEKLEMLCMEIWPELFTVSCVFVSLCKNSGQLFHSQPCMRF